MYHLYILLCDKTFFYTGITKDLDKRIREHKSKYSPYTKRYRDVELVYTEAYYKITNAKNRERQIKGWSSPKKKALVERNIAKLRKLSKNNPEVVEGSAELASRW